MQTTQAIAFAFLISLAGLASAAMAETVTPFVQAEATYTDSGLKYKGSTFAPNGYELGTGLTGGVLFDQKHEISLSTGYTKWTGPHNVVVGVADGHSTAEQVPLLLNYRYHLPLDAKGRFTVFAGPSVGFIHEKHTQTIVKLGGGYVGPTGETSDSDWKFAGGGTVGLNAKIGKAWSVGAAAQLLEASGSTYSEYGGLAHTTEKSSLRPSFALSAGYSW